MDRSVIYVVIVAVVAVIAGIGTVLYLYPPHNSTTSSIGQINSTTSISNTTSTATPPTTSSVSSSSSSSGSSSFLASFFNSTSGAFTVNQGELQYLVSYRPAGVSINRTANLVKFTGNTVYIVVLAGPPSNILTFQLFNLTDPIIEVPLDSTVVIAVIDVGYLNHSFGITSSPPPYPASVSPNQDKPAFPGSEMPPTLLTNGLSPASSNTFSGYLLRFNATTAGTYWYLCFVPGHASSGMYGKFIVYG